MSKEKKGGGGRETGRERRGGREGGKDEIRTP